MLTLTKCRFGKETSHIYTQLTRLTAKFGEHHLRHTFPDAAAAAAAADCSASPAVRRVDRAENSPKKMTS